MAYDSPERLSRKVALKSPDIDVNLASYLRAAESWKALTFIMWNFKIQILYLLSSKAAIKVIVLAHLNLFS